MLFVVQALQKAKISNYFSRHDRTSKGHQSDFFVSIAEGCPQKWDLFILGLPSFSDHFVGGFWPPGSGQLCLRCRRWLRARGLPGCCIPPRSLRAQGRQHQAPSGSERLFHKCHFLDLSSSRLRSEECMLSGADPWCRWEVKSWPAPHSSLPQSFSIQNTENYREREVNKNCRACSRGGRAVSCCKHALHGSS